MAVTEVQKEGYLNVHLWYEIEMVRYTQFALPAERCRMRANALIDSFDMHARNLLDFLYNIRKDVSARHFVLPTDRAAKKIKYEGEVKDVYGLIHQQTLHLGQERPTAEQDNLNAAQRQVLLYDIEARLAIFEAAMLPLYRAIWNKTKADARSAPLGPEGPGTIGSGGFTGTGPSNAGRLLGPAVSTGTIGGGFTGTAPNGSDRDKQK
jgi:hypothetical protein